MHARARRQQLSIPSRSYCRDGKIASAPAVAACARINTHRNLAVIVELKNRACLGRPRRNGELVVFPYETVTVPPVVRDEVNRTICTSGNKVRI
jgi:hypothetical protein